MTKQLLFVDTNIWLDFYRSRTEAGLSLLKHLDAISDRIIITYLVEMEFKKHRQSVIVKSIRELEPPEVISRPGLFSDAKAAKALQKNRKRAEELIRGMKGRLSKIFEKPAVYDPVYKVSQRVFHKQDALNLRRDMKIRRMIRRKALTRFLLGCPPRKHDDTSIGDAVNWEWVVHCAEMTKSNIVLVSRDSDYGVVSENKAYLNDHLKHEFSERVSKKRKIHLYAKLSDALKHFQVNVTQQEKEEETRLIESSDAVAETTRRLNVGDLIRIFETERLQKTNAPAETS
jgi:hypothetical protein